MSKQWKMKVTTLINTKQSAVEVHITDAIY